MRAPSRGPGVAMLLVMAFVIMIIGILNDSDSPALTAAAGESSQLVAIATGSDQSPPTAMNIRHFGANDSHVLVMQSPFVPDSQGLNQYALVLDGGDQGHIPATLPLFAHAFIDTGQAEVANTGVSHANQSFIDTGPDAFLAVSIEDLTVFVASITEPVARIIEGLSPETSVFGPNSWVVDPIADDNFFSTKFGDGQNTSAFGELHYDSAANSADTTQSPMAWILSPVDAIATYTAPTNDVTGVMVVAMLSTALILWMTRSSVLHQLEAVTNSLARTGVRLASNYKAPTSATDHCIRTSQSRLHMLA